VLWRFCPFVGFWRFYLWMYVDLMTCILGDVWFISAATVENFYTCMLFEFWCEDVASISWIFALFACIIALIEIGCYIIYRFKCLRCYNVVSKPCRYCPYQNRVIFLFVCEWFWVTFDTCSIVLTCWFEFCVEVRWLVVEMMRQL